MDLQSSSQTDVSSEGALICVLSSNATSKETNNIVRFMLIRSNGSVEGGLEGLGEDVVVASDVARVRSAGTGLALAQDPSIHRLGLRLLWPLLSDPASLQAEQPKPAQGNQSTETGIGKAEKARKSRVDLDSAVNEAYT
jgi:hypothetical protein